MEPENFAFYLLTPPAGSVWVVLRGGTPLSWTNDATILADEQSVRYWAITDGVAASILGDARNGILVTRRVLDLLRSQDTTVVGQPALVETSGPTNQSLGEYYLVRPRRRVAYQTVHSSSMNEPVLAIAVIAEYPAFVVVSAALRSSLEVEGVESGCFSLPLLAV